jgi:hypothetical protein
VGFAGKTLVDLIRRGAWSFYEPIFRTMIHRFKYRRQMGAFSKMDCLLKKYFEENLNFSRDLPLLLFHYTSIK